jgi:SAM-dependent methyltransferase
MSQIRSTQRFSNRVADYVRYRPDYPPELIVWLRDSHGIDASWMVADIGAGTGISAKMFLDAGHSVFAVEPNAPMRKASEDWLGGDPKFHPIDGTAEATTLADHSVDLICAAQAFHWFDRDAVKREWARILRHREATGEGLAAIFWNTRRLTGTPFRVGYEKLLHDFGIDYVGITERYAGDRAMRDWFGAGWRGMASFPHRQLLEFDALRGRLLSSSYMPGADHPRHATMIEALRQLFDATQIDGKVGFDYDTRIFLGTLAPS